MGDMTLKQPACNYRVVVIAPSAPPLKTGGVATAHYNLFRGLVGLHCEATFLTFNEFAKCSYSPGILRSGTSAWMRTVLALGVNAFLKMKGSKKLAYQLHDIIGAVPGVLRVNRFLERLDPDILIIPDRCAPGLFLRKRRAKILQVIHHVPRRFVEQLSLIHI